VRTFISYSDATGTWINLYRNKKNNKTKNNDGLSIWFYAHNYLYNNIICDERNKLMNVFRRNRIFLMYVHIFGKHRKYL